jgi:hypothetical protein
MEPMFMTSPQKILHGLKKSGSQPDFSVYKTGFLTENSVV